MNKHKTAKPVFVSNCMECCDKEGHYIGETSVILNVRGDCVSKVYNGKSIESLNTPIARGGIFYSVKYEPDKDISIIEYRFRNGMFIDRSNASERFINKMQKQIDAQKIKDFKQQLAQEKSEKTL